MEEWFTCELSDKGASSRDNVDILWFFVVLNADKKLKVVKYFWSMWINLKLNCYMWRSQCLKLDIWNDFDVIYREETYIRTLHFQILH